MALANQETLPGNVYTFSKCLVCAPIGQSFWRQFPAKINAGCPKALRDFPPRRKGILLPLPCLGTPLPLPRVCTDVQAGVRGRQDQNFSDRQVTQFPYPWRPGRRGAPL